MFLISGFKTAKERLLGNDRQKAALLVLLILLCAGATYYFHFVLRSEVVFSHLFYVPIALAGLWWGKRAAWVGVLFGALLLASHFLSGLGISPLEDFLRSVMFVVVGLTVGILRERSLWAEQTLRKAHDELERRVEERTAELAKANEELRVEITKRKRAEESLKEYSERLEEMVEERTQELREAQEKLVRKEKLAILGQLAGGVGHELRNPLGVISNAVYFLQMTLPDADETTKEYLEMISEEVRNSTKIVSDLLDFSRTRLPEREEIAVSELVAEVLEKRPPPEKMEVITELAPDLPPVYVDPRQMGQVLVNLVTNAYQAMPEGGALTISAQAEEGQVALSVADTGCGISKEHMAKLFEPLFTTRARGIGLGLAVSRILVEANGGSIEVESEVGQGSTFTVRLPTREVVA